MSDRRFDDARTSQGVDASGDDQRGGPGGVAWRDAPVHPRGQKPEAAYFTEMDGRRTGIIIVDVKDPSQIPALAEPYFLAVNAEVGSTSR